jgi:hypothetical protein
MNQEYKIIIKPIKPKMKETDPEKIEALKEKRRLQRETRKNKPKEDKQPKEKKEKINNSEEIDNLNKSLKNLIGYSIDEINEKIKSLKVSPVQLGPEPVIVEEVVKDKKKKKIKSNI